MRHARGQAQNDRRIVFFGKFEGELGKIFRLLAVGRLQHGHFRADRGQAGILLVLRREYGRIVRHGDDEAAVHARIRGGKERVARHVEADVLHGNDGASPLYGRADAHFQGHLFVRRPFAVYFGKARELFRDFRGRRSGISGSDVYARLPCAARDGEIAEKKFFHICSNLPMYFSVAVFQFFLRSVTRLTLPSARLMEKGSTSFTFTSSCTTTRSLCLIFATSSSNLE